MNSKQETILRALSTQKEPITANDIYSGLKQAGDEELLSLARTSAELTNMRNKRLVENGESEIINGRSRLTWLIAGRGREMLTDSKASGDRSESDCPSTDGIKVEELDEMPSDVMDMRKPSTEAPIHVVTGDLDIDAIKRELTETLERYFGPAEQPDIDNIGLKIDTLERLAPMLSPDINNVLLAIADDLKQLNAA